MTGLRRAIGEYLTHYRAGRAHQGLGNERIERTGNASTGEVQCCERLGAILKYSRPAA